jgi:hypothetical protein
MFIGSKSFVCAPLLQVLYPSFSAFSQRYATVFTHSNGKHPQAQGKALKCDVKKRIFIEPVCRFVMRLHISF